MNATLLPWHAESFRRFNELGESQRLPHALLLDGAPGTGRNAFANLLAAQLLCAAPTIDGPCGDCKSCALFVSGAHPDLHRVTPEEEGKSIGIGAIRDAIMFASKTASTSRYKVLLVTPTESMTTAAYNAFLKCLEEPADNTVVLLVFAKGNAMPATIRSRCQRWPLTSPSAAEVRPWLSEQSDSIDPDDQAWSRLFTLSDSRPLIALQWHADAKMSSAVLDFADSLGSVGSGMASAERAAANLAPELFLDLLERHLRGVLLQMSASDLRGRTGSGLVAALDVMHSLRGAVRAGTNPNPDLLRLRALDAASGLWLE